MSVLNTDLKVLQANGVISNYSIYFQQAGDSSISMQLDDGGVLKFEGQDLFCSLRLLRKYFEERGAKVLCNGARIDGYSSGMSRSTVTGSQ